MHYTQKQFINKKMRFFRLNIELSLIYKQMHAKMHKKYSILVNTNKC